LNPRASTTREEKAKIGPAALIKLASLISISKNLTTHARIFEDECCSYILRLNEEDSTSTRDVLLHLKIQ